MDPKTVLEEARQAIVDEDATLAHELMSNYAAWRRRGGFEPQSVGSRRISGDSFFGVLVWVLREVDMSAYRGPFPLSFAS